ncbi:MAG: sigma factor, partial [Armatimonadota bacterium]
MQNKTDTQLVLRARAGELRAFDELVQRYRPMAERVAHSALGRTCDAQEIAHESLLRAYLSLPHLQNPEQFASWLHGIV